MKLIRVEVRNYRSIFDRDSTAKGLRLNIENGLNVLVGRNNCGKSNFFRALSLALDPEYQFDVERDVPGPVPHQYPSVQLRFKCDPSNPDEQALLDAATDYEHSLAQQSGSTNRPTFASQHEIVLRVSYGPDSEGRVIRRESLVGADGSDLIDPYAASRKRDDFDRRRVISSDTYELNKVAIAAFRQLVRFVMIRSGESIESVLEGNFREILHSVVQERMGEQFETAEEHRLEYIRGLQADLLGPLRDRVLESVKDLFPEIGEIYFEPDVADIEATLSRVEIGLEDSVQTPLTEKGTGVRGGVLVAMLRYLAANTNRCVVMAIEEPEAFLHPAAQEDLREQLEELAARDDVSVLVTTHSPFVVSKLDNSVASLLSKRHNGQTFVAVQSRGDDERVGVISGIVREQSFEEILRGTQAIDPDKRAVLIVEGYTDKQYIELAAKATGRWDLIADIHIEPSHGTTKMMWKTPIIASVAERAVAVVCDTDHDGLKAHEQLLSLKGADGKPFFAKRRLIKLSQAMPGDVRGNFAWEAEDLFEGDLADRFVEANGGLKSPIVKGHEKRDTGLHLDMDGEGKVQFLDFLMSEVKSEHCNRWIELFRVIRKALDLPEVAEVAEDVPSPTPKPQEQDDGGAGTTDTPDEPAPADSSPASEPAGSSAPEPDERVLVVSQNYGHAEYLRSNVFVGEPGRGLSSDIRYVAFYENGVIREEVPKVLGRYDDLVFTTDLAERLNASSEEADTRVAKFISDELEAGRRAPGDVRQVFILSTAEDQDTIRLAAPIANTKLSPKGRPMAWVVRHKLTWSEALRSGATTTDELDAYEETKQ